MWRPLSLFSANDNGKTSDLFDNTHGVRRYQAGWFRKKGVIASNWIK